MWLRSQVLYIILIQNFIDLRYIDHETHPHHAITARGGPLFTWPSRRHDRRRRGLPASHAFADSDACNPNPCLNGGSCDIDANGGHFCSCSGDFYGMSCQIETAGERQNEQRHGIFVVRLQKLAVCRGGELARRWYGKHQEETGDVYGVAPLLTSFPPSLPCALLSGLDAFFIELEYTGEWTHGQKKMFDDAAAR